MTYCYFIFETVKLVRNKQFSVDFVSFWHVIIYSIRWILKTPLSASGYYSFCFNKMFLVSCIGFIAIANFFLFVKTSYNPGSAQKHVSCCLLQRITLKFCLYVIIKCHELYLQSAPDTSRDSFICIVPGIFTASLFLSGSF